MIDVDHCPTCEQPYLECGTPWPPSLSDVTALRCKLPRGHRSAEHWHRALWPTQPPIVWLDEPANEPANVGR